MGERFSDMEKAALVGKQASLGEIRPSEMGFPTEAKRIPRTESQN